MTNEEKNLLVMLTGITLEMNRESLKIKFAEYDKAVREDRENDAACAACYNQELASNVYLAEKECKMSKIRRGERITDKGMDFLLSDAEFFRLCRNTHKRLVAAGLIDENGYYTNQTTTRRVKCFWELANLCVDSVPEPMRDQFRDCRHSVVWAEKLMDIFRKTISK